MTTNAPVMYEVLRGPSTQDTINSFTWAFDKIKTSVRFQVRMMGGTYEIWLNDVTITGIKYESGAPGMFLLEFNAPGWTKCSGYYNANSRTGHFTMTPRRGYAPKGDGIEG